MESWTSQDPDCKFIAMDDQILMVAALNCEGLDHFAKVFAVKLQVQL